VFVSAHNGCAAAGKCSALVKVTADLSDIFFGHSTWDSFTAMTRIFKHYQFNLKQVGTRAAQQLSQHLPASCMWSMAGHVQLQGARGR
jgi:hypothetical protein